MKTIVALAIAAFISAVGPVWAAESITPTKRTVDLADMVERINASWIGKAMSDIIGTDKVRSVIVLKNLTSMPADGHAAGIRRVIRSDPKLMKRPANVTLPKGFGDNGASNFWFDAVVILENGNTFRIERSTSIGRLSTEKGQAYFEISDGKSNKKIDSDKK